VVLGMALRFGQIEVDLDAFVTPGPLGAVHDHDETERSSS
jgi:hypothetical protein